MLHVCDPRYLEPFECTFDQFLDHYESDSDGINGTWERSFTTKGNKVSCICLPSEVMDARCGVTKHLLEGIDC